MGIGRHRHREGGEEAGRAFNPWAPRNPDAGQSPRAEPAKAGPAGAGPSPSTSVAGAPAGPPLSAELGGRAPVADEYRPPGATSTPPTTWPQPRLEQPTVGESPTRRSGTLVALVAFLVGILAMGGVFVAYAYGQRNGTAATVATTTTKPSRATGPLDIQKILDTARPSVVTIQTGSADSLFGGAGSGVVISEDGLILTNAHVVAGAGGAITIRFSDGTTAEADLVGASTPDDIALVRAKRTDLTPATLGSSANLLVGDPVVAIGNALNLGGDPSVTSGIVSAKNRSISDGSISLENLIQTDAAINPGNSGGPLVNADGDVVGINTAIIAGAQNVGFSIAIDSVEDLIEVLKDGGGDVTADTATLGVTTIDVNAPELDASIKEQLGITAEAGAVIRSVDPSGSASAAGIAEGDVVVTFDGAAVNTSTELTALVRDREPGDEVDVVVERQGERERFTVTLGP